MTLRTAFAKTRVAGSEPLTYTMSYESVLHTNLIVVERRKQQSDGTYPRLPEWRWGVYLGDVPTADFQMVTLAPSVAGYYRYDTYVIDNLTGAPSDQDELVLSVNGSVTPAQSDVYADFFANPTFPSGAKTPIRVTYGANVFSGVIIEWNIYSILENQVAVTPVRTVRIDMDQWYAGDVQFIVDVTEQPGEYVWEWRVIDNQANAVLASKQRHVNVVDAAVPLAEVLPPTPHPAPEVAAAKPAPAPKQGIPIEAIGMGVAVLVVGILAGMAVKQ